MGTRQIVDGRNLVTRHEGHVSARHWQETEFEGYFLVLGWLWKVLLAWPRSCKVGSRTNEWWVWPHMKTSNGKLTSILEVLVFKNFLKETDEVVSLI